MVIQFFCTICHEDFDASCDIDCTKCGHVFHSRCLLDWFTRSQSCPDCRTTSASYELKKLFVKTRIVDEEDISEKNIKLKTQIEQSLKNLTEVQHALDESEKNFSELQKQFDIVEKGRSELLSAKKFSQIIIQSLEKELEAKRTENREACSNLELTKQKMEQFDNKSSTLLENKANFNRVLGEKNKLIENLKKEIADKTLELQKEIRNSTLLIVEKMKLQEQLNATTTGNQQHASQVANTGNKTNLTDADFRSLSIKINNCELNGLTAQPDLGAAKGAVKKRPARVRGRLEQPVYELFIHAKKLYKVGFRDVFYEGNEIFAKKADFYPRIKIHSQNQVDDLVKEFQPLVPPVTAKNKVVLDKKENPENCDEFFYAK